MAKKGIMVIGAILAISIAGGAFFVGWLMGNEWQFGDTPQQITPTIDGVIERREWLRSSYFNIPFYLDIDNTIDPIVDLANVDGWNFLSVGEDEDYYYIAVDLCSDRTNNKEDEWFALHLANRLPDTHASKLAFYSLEDYGYEYLFYNVSGDDVFDFYLNANMGLATYYDIPLVPEMDSMEVLRGTAEGDFYDFWTEFDDKNLTATSTYYESEGIWLPGDFLDLHFSVNITEKIPDEIIPLFMGSIDDMDLEYTIKSNVTSNPPIQFGDPTLFYFCLYEHGPTPGNITELSFASVTKDVYLTAGSTEQGLIDLDHTRINMTDGMFYFTLHGWNDVDALPTGYQLEIDKLSLQIHGGDIASLIGNTIETGNYELAYSYGPSDNCAEDHRMFEFKIAKAEFPPLGDELLYLRISGYGTMAIVGTNYWVYPMYGFPLPPMYSDVFDSDAFLTFDMSIV